MTNPIIDSSLPSIPQNSRITAEPTGSASSISSDLVRNAMIRPSDSSLSQFTIDRITSLREESAFPPSWETSTPAEFFELFNVGITVFLGYFKNEDIEYLQNIIQKHPHFSRLRLHDLFGMEFDRILSDLQPFLPKSIWTDLHQEWAALYFSGYLGMIGSHKVHDEFNMQISPGTYLSRMMNFTRKLNTALNDHHIKFQNSSSSSTTLQGNFSNILNEWKKAQRVLCGFLCPPKDPSLKDASELLVKHIPSADSGVEIDSEEEIASQIEGTESHQSLSETHYIDTLKKTSLEPLQRFVKVMESSQHAKFKGNNLVKEIPFFKEIHEQLEMMMKLTDPDELEKKGEKLLKFIIKTNDELYELAKQAESDLKDAQARKIEPEKWFRKFRKEDRIQLKHTGFIELFSQRMRHLTLAVIFGQDIRTILEHTFLSKLNPEISTSSAHSTRAFVNLSHFIQKYVAEECIPLQDKIGLTEQKFIKFFKSNKIIKTMNSLLSYKGKKTDPTFCILSSDLKSLYDSLTPLITSSLEVFSKESFNPIPEGESLTEQTLWFSRILLLYHDIGVVLRVRSPKEDILPASFLEFLAGPSDASEIDPYDLFTESDLDEIPEKIELPVQDSETSEFDISPPELSSELDEISLMEKQRNAEEHNQKVRISSTLTDPSDSPPKSDLQEPRLSTSDQFNPEPEERIAGKKEAVSFSSPREPSSTNEDSEPSDLGSSLQISPEISSNQPPLVSAPLSSLPRSELRSLKADKSSSSFKKKSPSVQTTSKQEPASSSGPSQSSSKSESSSSAGRIDPVIAREIRTVTKRRQVEDILTRLNLKSTGSGKGSHTVWKNEDETIAVTVPHHPELKPGLRNSLFKDLTEPKTHKFMPENPEKKKKK